MFACRDGGRPGLFGRFRGGAAPAAKEEFGHPPGGAEGFADILLDRDHRRRDEEDEYDAEGEAEDQRDHGRLEELGLLAFLVKERGEADDGGDCWIRLNPKWQIRIQLH